MKTIYKCEVCGRDDFEDKTSCYIHENKCGKNNKVIPVMELFIATQTKYENPREFYIHKKTIPITEIFANKLKGLNSIENGLSKWLKEEWYEDIQKYDSKFADLVFEDLTREYGIVEKNIEGYVCDKKDYYCTGDGYIYFEIFFKDDFNDSDLAKAYISVFNLNVEDLEKQDDVDLTLTKWMTNNVHDR